MADYEKLKEDVKQLKADRKELVHQQHARKLMGERALAEIRGEYEEAIRQRDDEIARLKKQLNDSTQRESRHRSRLDKSTAFASLRACQVIDTENREMKRLLSKHSKLAVAYESDKTLHRTAIDRLAAECEDSSKKEADLARQKLQTQREEMMTEFELRLRSVHEAYHGALSRWESRQEQQTARLSEFARSLSVEDRAWASRCDALVESLDDLQKKVFEQQKRKLQNALVATKDLSAAYSEERNKRGMTQRDLRVALDEGEEKRRRHEHDLHHLQQKHVHNIQTCQQSHMRELDEIRLRVHEVLEEKEKVIVDLTNKMQELQKTLSEQNITLVAFASDMDIHPPDS